VQAICTLCSLEQPTSVQQSLAVKPKDRSPNDVDIICTLLRSLVFFRRLSPAAQHGFAEACLLRHCEEGDILTEEGSMVRFLHIILQGECSVKVAIGGGKGGRPIVSPAVARGAGGKKEEAPALAALMERSLSIDSVPATTLAT